MQKALPGGDRVRSLTLFFGIAYFAQGIAQIPALIDQPLTNYLRQDLHLDAAQVASRTAILLLPWTIKPLYGLLSDFAPLAGYRRKTYLLLTGLLATLGFLYVTGQAGGAGDLQGTLFALLLTSFGIAFSDVLVDAVMVEQGKVWNAIGRFQATQWLWISAAGILSALVGGWLAQYLPGAASVRVAAALVAFAPLVVSVAGWFIIPEQRASGDKTRLCATGKSLLNAFRSRRLWSVIAFLILWKFSPSFGKPLYFHMTEHLKFSQSFIGYLSALGSAAGILGAFLFPRLTQNQPERRVLAVAVFLSALTTLSYLLLRDAVSGVLLSIATGFFEMLLLLTTLDLAARACAKDVEGFSFAALMSVLNLTAQGSAVLGAWLYVHAFHNSLPPLIYVSAGATLLAYFALPYLGNEGEGVSDAWSASETP